MAHIGVIDAYLKQKTPLTVEEIADIAEEVVAKYYWVLSFADVHLVFRNARNGVYGELYNNLTASKVLGWFAQYEQERCKKCEERAQSKSKEEQNENSNEELTALGYRIDEHGHIVINNPNMQYKKKPMRYIYDDKGNIKGENQMYWASVRQKEEKTSEEMSKINKQNRVMERVHAIMKDNPEICYLKAVEQAVKEVENLNFRSVLEY